MEESQDIAHFRSMPWCARHLSTTKPNERIVVEQALSRRPKKRLEDALFSYTLHTDDTIAAFATFYTLPDPDDGRELVRELKAFLTLGPMVNGWPGICHGGIVMTIMDEVMGLLPPINKRRGLIPTLPFMTAYLNTQFIRPVKTAETRTAAKATILATARLDRIEGRKYFTNCTIEDESGTVLAKAEALFVLLKEKL
ncbi:Verlamelin biosynthesis protein B [Diplogelasinospora grovesii]|uniref:Verlamelin biosynthesis protein B n=1 Tax=Diplogelasinospora grovesii TaxID=303347 RepID=A0AAN6S077_9PEZI|nr:Verlamelin biosynthesis protein B [Diplogelasinospora grovesii]